MNGTRCYGYKSIILLFTMLIVFSSFSAYAEVCFTQESSISLFFAKVFKYAVVYTVLSIVFFYISDRADNKKRTQAYEYSLKKGLMLAGGLAFVYAFYLLVNYPGLCGWDTVNQIWDCITGTKPVPFGWRYGQVEISVLMNNHHPVFTTLIFTLFYKIGLLVGSAEAGMFLYCLLQIVILSCLFSNIIFWLVKTGLPTYVIIICIIFYCTPFIAYFTICMIKDSLFALVFTIYYYVYITYTQELLASKLDSSRGQTVVQKESKEWIKLVILSLLMAVTNKKGMYLAFVSNIMLIAVAPDKRTILRSCAASLLPVIMVVVLLNSIIFPWASIYPGGKQEAMNFAFQQSARMYLDHPEVFTEEDKKIFSSILLIDVSDIKETYDPTTTDNIKDRYNYYSDKKITTACILMWFRHGIKHPKTYIRATLEVNGGYYSLCKSINKMSDPPYVEEIKAFHQPQRLISVKEKMSDSFLRLESLPVISLFFMDALYAWFIPVGIMATLLLRRDKHTLLFLVPIFANVLFLILGPVCWTRYALCQLFSVPLMLALLYIKPSLTKAC